MGNSMSIFLECSKLKLKMGRVYSCHKCGSRFDNAKIFAVHVKVTCLKGDFIKQTGKKKNFKTHNDSEMVKKTNKL